MAELTRAAWNADAVAALRGDLERGLRGEARFDALSRAIYATDASIYQMVPAGVVLPRDTDDVVFTVNACRAHGVPIVPRGAGTGLAGGAVGPGIQLDLSHFMREIGPVDVERCEVRVQAGVVLDELNATAAGAGLHFAPDVATSSRATIGGMIANNSCGAHSVMYGRTVDHVRALTMVLADGSVIRPGSDGGPGSGVDAEGDTRLSSIAASVAGIRDGCADEIAARFPKVMRSNGGYGLDRLGPRGSPPDLIGLVCGSEGTLGVVTEAVLGLTPIPRYRALLVATFDDVITALGVTPAALRHEPAAVELIDHLIIEAGMTHRDLAARCPFLDRGAAAVMVVELVDDDRDALTSRLEKLKTDPGVSGEAMSAIVLDEPRDQDAVWQMRGAGLGLLMSKPGDAQPHAFVEDSAVAPDRLAAYIARFQEMVADAGTTAGYYAHASVGCIHVRPVLNLKKSSDVARMAQLADSVSSLALEFGGAFTGEHGDGLLRSCWAEKMYGPQIVEAFRAIKAVFDPGGIMNPHKIVDPLPMTTNLRWQPDVPDPQLRTTLDFSRHGGMLGLANMCSGVGQCRQTLAGTMCPSYVATRDETHTTRARANALRLALSDQGLLAGIGDARLGDVLDLCLACKACKSECPTGVDMAKLKAEYLHHRHLRQGAGPRARMLSDLPELLARAGRFPRLANTVGSLGAVRRYAERRFGLDARIAPPRFATTSFRKWFARHRRRREPRNGRPAVVYFVDTWTNWFTPQVGVAAVKLLERAGYHVLCPATICCGRTSISAGLLREARERARSNVRMLAPFLDGCEAVVGTEPSCLLTLTDEYPALLRSPAALRLADRAFMVDQFLADVLDRQPGVLPFQSTGDGVLLHTHCHQKSGPAGTSATRFLQHVDPASPGDVGAGCCGMAGAFGQEVEHYDVARAIAEDRLLPAIRERGSAVVAVTGFSCRQQIRHHAGFEPRHIVEIAADRLLPRASA